MNKKVIGLILAGMMSLSIVGCGNNDNVVEEKTEIVIENQNVEDFKKRDILSYEIETKRDGDYLDMKITVTNNGDKPINNHWFEFGLYDGDGNKIGDLYASDEAVIQPGKSCICETSTSVLDARDVQLIEYQYEVPSEKEKVVLNKEVNTVDVHNIE